MSITVEEFLAHNGVKGMKWGVRKEEDSAASTSKAAAVQQKRDGKAQKYELRAATYSTRISELNSTEYRFKYQARSANKQVQDLEKLKAQALKDAEAKKQGKLSRGQKQLIAGAVIVGAIVATAVVANTLESGEGRRLLEKGKAVVRGGSATDFKKNTAFADKSLNADGVFEKVVKGINPDYGKFGTTNNCRRATFAYEMRRRGYDVMATKTSEGRGQTAGGLVNALSPGKKLLPSSSASIEKLLQKEQATKSKHRAAPITSAMFGALHTKIESDNPIALKSNLILDKLNKEPSGSRGELAVEWLGGGLHSLAYEVFDGKATVFDTQSGAKYSSVEEIASGLGMVKTAGFTRLDNADLNKDFLLRWVKNGK